MPCRLIALVAGVILFGSMGELEAQARPASDTRLRVFIDCELAGCDFDLFRTEIAFVDHVRDRADADVHALITNLANGGGGKTYSIAFIPRGTSSLRSDTLTFTTAQSATSDEHRRAIARILKVGLLQYLAHMPGNTRFEVTYLPDNSAGTASAAPKHDPWNAWVFRTSMNSFFNGEKSQRSAYLGGSTSAKRITEGWKISVVGNGSYNESKFTFSDDQHFANYSHSYGASQTVVKSLNAHWSAGEKAVYSSSTYLNQRANYRIAPAIEYNFFKYAEATRRQLTLQYSPGVSHYRYEERTVYGKLSETHPNHSLTASIDLKQPWGNVSSSLEGASLLDDFSKNHLVSYTNFSVRVFKGLNFNMYSGLSLIRDQLYIPGADLSDAEILTRRRQLATSYSYYGGIGLSYTFGSVLNNVVNPRFGGSNGGFIVVE